jgi:chemotaxis protein CheD
MPALSHRAAAMPRSEALPRFDHVPRFWDPKTGYWTAKVLPGQYYVTNANESIATVLGSCVAACLRDTDSGLGGMNHFMLPEDRSGGTSDWTPADGSKSMRFGAFAMESLLNELFKQGAQRDRLELKLFGGGRVIQSAIDVGARNISFVRRYAATEGLYVAAEDLGGIVPRHVVYFPHSGRVLLKRLRTGLDPVVQDENNYRAALAEQSYENDVELFD